VGTRRGVGGILAAAAVLVAGCVVPGSGARPDGDRTDPVPDRAVPPMPAFIPHEAWEAHAPLGHAADATRRNLAAGDTLRFRGLVVIANSLVAGTAGAGDSVELELVSGPSRDRLRLENGAALNWGGHRIAAVSVNAGSTGLGAGLASLEVATVESLPPSIAASTEAGNAAQRLRVPHTIHTITLHHTGDAQPLLPEHDPAARLRGLQNWGRTDRNWWDVPYHFLIDLDGNIYEGRDWRFMGETNTRYDPSGHLLISVIGNYEIQHPTEAQIRAVTDLMAWGAASFDVPLERILGHGDLTPTSCPGRWLRGYLDDGTFRRGVEQRLRGTIRRDAQPPPTLSPASTGASAVSRIGDSPYP
jgi:hypothetical protein